MEKLSKSISTLVFSYRKAHLQVTTEKMAVDSFTRMQGPVAWFFFLFNSWSVNFRTAEK